jgi:hypothetical protein
MRLDQRECLHTYNEIASRLMITVFWSEDSADDPVQLAEA